MAAGELIAVILAPAARLKVGLYKMQPGVWAMRAGGLGWLKQHWQTEASAMKTLLGMQSYGPNERTMLEKICAPEFSVTKITKKRK